MLAIRVTVELVDDETGEVVKYRAGRGGVGGGEVKYQSRFYPLFAEQRRGEETANGLYKAFTEIMHVGNTFYRIGGEQKDL